MIIYKFDKEKISEVKNLADAFALIGISIDDKHEAPYSVEDKTIFGEQGHYANLFITDKTYLEIYEQLKPLGRKWRNRAGHVMPSSDALQWSNYGPVSSGPLLDHVKEELNGKEMEDYTLYLFTPEDKWYIPSPLLEDEKA